jgi:diguanylate cyclase (GGDEF)-like protein
MVGRPRPGGREDPPTMSVPRLIESVAEATAHRDRDDLDAAIARLLFDAIDAERITVWRVLDEAGELRVQRRVSLARGAPELGPEEATAELPRVAAHPHWHECVMLHDIVHYQPTDHRGLRSLFPLRTDSAVVGMLEIEAGDGLDPRQAGLVTGVLRIIRNHLALLDYGERDMLTGLLNRKTFEAGFGKLRARARRGADAQPAWLALADVDRFKSINDSHGHLFGDEVLLLVSRLMRECFRGGDRMYRFGGEEFVIVLEQADTAGAAAALNRFRLAVAHYAFPQVGRVTVSVGYTQVLPGDSPASAVERADAALYYAKHHGRNQVQGHEALLAAGELKIKATRCDVELF